MGVLVSPWKTEVDPAVIPTSLTGKPRPYEF